MQGQDARKSVVQPQSMISRSLLNARIGRLGQHPIGSRENNRLICDTVSRAIIAHKEDNAMRPYCIIEAVLGLKSTSKSCLSKSEKVLNGFIIWVKESVFTEKSVLMVNV